MYNLLTVLLYKFLNVLVKNNTFIYIFIFFILAEDHPSSSTSRKSTVLSAGNKIKSKIPTTHFGRNAMQVR